MRPEILTPLFASVSTLSGVGPKLFRTLTRLLGEAGPVGARVLDALFHLPTHVLDRSNRPKIAQAPLDTLVMVEVTIERHRSSGGKGPYRVFCFDDTGDLTLTFFSAQTSWIERALPPGEKRWVSGKIELYDAMRQMVHPDRIVDQAGLASLPLFEPVYPLTEGLFPRQIQKIAKEALEKLPELDEWQDEAWLHSKGWPSFKNALTQLHTPADPAVFADDSAARERLAYDELLASQLALALVRASNKVQPGIAITGTGEISARIMASLPFQLTSSQSGALSEIRADIASPHRMVRLLQGDVGSGKTAVALLAMATIVEGGRQAALMAPTEILARQHLATIQPLALTCGLRVDILTGRHTLRERTRIQTALKNGEIDIIIGTHALFQEGVEFRDLGLAIVDEQHRFGVHQRLAIGSKNAAVDVLVMTATPIPRSLILTCFGDMDLSVLREKPAGRQPVDTRLVSLERLGEVVAALQRQLAGGGRAYWVCPLIEDSETLDVAAAQERFTRLSDLFGNRVGLLHGKMKPADKDAVMARFISGEISLLVSTTVIEVGVNVPEATVMVIEHAERFGLAQLHQLRGRIGRGSEKSTCLLLYKGPLGETARQRLEIMRQTEDGFLIAEEDLKLRGEGDILGTRQSGIPGFRLAQLDAHRNLLPVANQDAKLVLARDPDLSTPRGKALRTLLYLFERDEAVRLLRSG